MIKPQIQLFFLLIAMPLGLFLLTEEPIMSLVGFFLGLIIMQNIGNKE